MIDFIRMKIKAGDGGRGAVAWRHEKFYANGGPFGGDGGRGGDIYFQVDTNETTLTKLRFTHTVKAGNGMPGLTKKMHGADGDDVYIKVPLGTLVRNAENGDLMADLTRPNQVVKIARGGKGGLGNMHFATARNNTPEYAQPGEIGEGFELQVELRLLADAGLIGFPSAGKSTFLSVVTRARPEIAAYPFTTIEPNIGVAMLPDRRSFVLADMPGLIEGAADGKGLGHEFLRHIRRCRVLIHVIDMSGWERDPLDDYRIINEELASYDEELIQKPQIVVCNKMDVEESLENYERFVKAYPDVKTFKTSTLQHKGIDPVLYAAMDEIEAARLKAETEVEKSEEVVTYRYEPKQPDFKIENLGSGKWKVVSDKIDRLVDTVDFENADDTYNFAMTLQKMGVDKKLAELGCQPGDEVIIGTFIMEYQQ